MNYSKGDIVVFNGKKHFTKPNGKVFFTIKPGVAKITAVMEGALHPYHLVAVPSDNSTVNGWVDEDTIAKKQTNLKIKSISFANNKTVQIGFAVNVGEGIDVLVSDWKDAEWTTVFRFKDSENAEKLAYAAEIARSKKHVDNASVYGLDFIEICGLVAELGLGEDLTKAKLIQSGLCYCFTSDFYTKESQYLRRGDILINNQTSAIVLSSGKKCNKQMATSNPKPVEEETPIETPKIKSIAQPQENLVITAENEPKEKDPSLAGVYTGITPAFMRQDAGVDNPVIVKLPKGLTYKNYEYYTEKNKNKWLYVQVKYKNNTYNGFVSNQCLIKK